MMKPSIFKTLAQPVRKVKEDQLLNKNKNQPVYESKVQKIEAIKAKYNITQQTTTRRQELTHYKSNSRSISAGKTRQNNRRILNENMNYGNTKDSRNIRNFQSQKQTLAKHTKTESKENIDNKDTSGDNVNKNTISKQRPTSSLSEFWRDHEFIEFLK